MTLLGIQKSDQKTATSIYNVYNMSGHVALNIQSRAETTYETTRKHLCSLKMLKIPTILAEKVAREFYEKQCNTVTSGCISVIQSLAAARHLQQLIKL